MADGGWALPKLQDTAGKTALHRAAQMGNTGAGDSARPGTESTVRAGTRACALCQRRGLRAAPSASVRASRRRSSAKGGLQCERRESLEGDAAPHGRAQREARERQAAGRGGRETRRADSGWRHAARARQEVSHGGR
eukprot:3196027-Prymnesium_polylepis.1